MVLLVCATVVSVSEISLVSVEVGQVQVPLRIAAGRRAPP